MPNPYHDPKNGRFTTKRGGGATTNRQPATVSSSKYGMKYSPRNAKVVAPARSVPDSAWGRLPVVKVKPRGLAANEKTLKTAPIRKVVSGAEPFRPNYITKLWKESKTGKLHVVDGHHRVAMYNALGLDMPSRVMTEMEFNRIMKKGKKRA